MNSSQTHFNPVFNFEEIRMFQACTCDQRFQPDASTLSVLLRTWRFAQVRLLPFFPVFWCSSHFPFTQEGRGDYCPLEDDKTAYETSAEKKDAGVPSKKLGELDLMVLDVPGKGEGIQVEIDGARKTVVDWIRGKARQGKATCVGIGWECPTTDAGNGKP